MGILESAEVTPESIGPVRARYLTHRDQLMMVVIDFNDGPTNEPDPPHSHPHEQVSYVVAGELYVGECSVPSKLSEELRKGL